MAHPVDEYVGKRIRHRRWMVGMTQQQLAAEVGIKFQQIQKYETGTNRVSASRLWGIANALTVDVRFFFEGLEADSGTEGAGDAAMTGPGAISDVIADKEALELVRAYYGVPELQRRRLLDLVRVLAETV